MSYRVFASIRFDLDQVRVMMPVSSSLQRLMMPLSVRVKKKKKGYVATSHTQKKELSSFSFFLDLFFSLYETIELLISQKEREREKIEVKTSHQSVPSAGERERERERERGERERRERERERESFQKSFCCLKFLPLKIISDFF